MSCYLYMLWVLYNVRTQNKYLKLVSHLLENTVEPVYCGHLRTNQKCPDYQGVLIFRSVYMIKHHLGP